MINFDKKKITIVTPFLANGYLQGVASVGVEGFGNTIVEAMACGTLVISTDCKSGLGEIICSESKKNTVKNEPNFEGFNVQVKKVLNYISARK